MAIQNRRGNNADFDATKMLPAELAVSLDEKKVYVAFAPGDVKEFAFKDDLHESEVTDEQVRDAVNDYLTKNPVASGATEEQAAQIEQNKSKIEQIQEDVKNKEESGTAENKVTEHNVSTGAHNDIRLLIQNALNAFEAFMDIDDESMNQATEFVAYMKDNRELIEQITTSKVSVSDIVDDYVTNVSNKPVSAAVAVKLKALIDAITVPTLLSQLGQDSTHRTVTDAEKETWNNKANKATTLAGYGITDGATKAELSQISEQIYDETTARENAILDLKAQRVQQVPSFAQGDTLEECLAWLEENGDASKTYIMKKEVSEYVYGYMAEKVEGGTVANFTNQLPISTDADGSVYNGKGFKEDTYLSSGTVATRDGVNTSGFVPIGCGSSASALGEQVVRIENTEATAVSNTRIALYDSSKNFVNTVLGTKLGDGVNVSSVNIPYETDENGYITYIDLTQYTYYVANNQKLTPAFFRICGTGIDSNTIITVNEEITYTTVEEGIVYGWKNTGHAFTPTDYEDRILALETENNQLKSDLDSAEQRIEVLENAESTNTTESETVPQAVIDGVSTLVNKSLSRADGNVIRFPIYSDAHQNNDNELITNGNRELGQAIGEIVKQISVDFVSSLGDNSWASYANTTETVREQLKQLNKFVNPFIKGEQILNCEGNHDDANYSTVDNDGDGTTSSTEKLSLAETFSLIYAKNKDVVFDADHYIDGYCYKDFEYLKTRVICLNTEQGTADGGIVEDYQLKWFAETALNMTGKTDWSVITLSHHPLDYPSNTLFKDCVNIVDAFINGSNFSYTTTNGTTISIDYSGKNCQYVGHFHGHAHAFSVVRMQKYVDGSYVDINAWEICIPNACYSRNNQYLGNTSERIARYCTETTYNKSDVDGQRTSFNLVTVDLDNKIIYADNYGAGIDREVSYSF